MDLLTPFVNSDNPVIALLAIFNVLIAGVVVYQWHYTANKTVPKWVWDSMLPKLERVLEVQERLLTILDERLKK